MYLDAVSSFVENASGAGVAAGREVPSPIYSRWENWPPSEISHHGRPCCEMAREHITTLDHSYLRGADIATGPRWLGRKFRWGPSRYPIHWCKAVRQETLDCGALAAMTDEIFAARGVTSWRVQVVQEYSANDAENWRLAWSGQGGPVDWLGGRYIYHECNAVEADGRLRIWDPSAGWWLDPANTTGYGSVAAVRVFAQLAERDFYWGPHRIEAGRWQTLDARD